MRIVQAAADGTVLEDGATVAGSDKYEVMLEAVEKNLASGIDFLQEGMSAFSKELKNLPENFGFAIFSAEITLEENLAF